LSVPALISYFRGYLTITVTGRFCERFINVCAGRKILLWDIKKISPYSVRCKISVSAFKKLASIAYHTGVAVHINIKHGFPFFLRKYKKRKIALFGALIFLIAVIAANQFVWDIEVRGNYKIPEEKIITALNESGLKIGMPISRIDQQELKKDALLKIPELAWLWVEKKGSKVIVDVREKIEVPEMFSPSDYCNIVASKDAIIENMTVKNGVPVVEKGETVLAGTVLVTGKIPVPAKMLDRYVRADAEILARVWYDRREVFSKISTTRHETGNTKNHYTLHFLGKDIPLFHKNKSPYKEFDVTEKRYTLFGLGFTKKSYEEITLQEEFLSDGSVADFGAAQIMQKLEEEVAPNSTLKSSEVSYTVLNDSTIEVCVKAEYLENIAIAQKEEVPEGLN